MKIAKKLVVLVAAAAYAGLVHAAYAVNCNRADDACQVVCSGNQVIGTMYWNGSNWSDGVRWDPNRHVVADLMARAWGAPCI